MLFWVEVGRYSKEMALHVKNSDHPKSAGNVERSGAGCLRSGAVWEVCTQEQVV